jgi:hypothetical protein
MRFQPTMCQYVFYGHTEVNKSASDQKSPVAIQWFPFSAHQNDTVLLSATYHAIDTGAKKVRLR